MPKFNFKKTIKTCWNKFNYWRRRYFYLRLGLLLMIAAPLFYERIITGGEPLICNLVRIACRAIQYGSQPRVISAWLHYNHSLEKQRLLLSLNKIKDQLSPEEMAALNVKPTKADLKQLFYIVQKHDILPKTANLRTVKQAMLTSAIGHTRQRFEPENQKVHKMIDACSYPDYSKWPTWKKGTLIFISMIIAFICPYPHSTSISWILLCLFTGAMIGKTTETKRGILTIAAIAAITTTLVLLKRYFMYCNYSATTLPLVRVHSTFYWNIFIYQICLGSVYGLLGSKILEKVKEKTDSFVASELAITGLGSSLIYASSGLFSYYGYHLNEYWMAGFSISLPNKPGLSSLIMIVGLLLIAWAVYRLIYKLAKKSGDASNTEVKTE